MSDGNMTYEDWLRGCVYHDGRHGYVTLPCDEVLKIADFIERLRADRKIEPQKCDDCVWSVCNYNKVDWEQAEQTENSSEKPNNCEDCEHWNDTEDGCADRHGCKTEPQKWETPPKFEHKGFTTTCVSVLAFAVEGEPQTDCPWK